MQESVRPSTLGELKASGYVMRSVREEMRRNVLGGIASGDPLLPGIIGYDQTVVPEVENALLAGHHMVFLGERGQGKSRIIRTLQRFLDPLIPVVAGCQINDDPLRPICAACRRAAATEGDALAIAWIGP